MEFKAVLLCFAFFVVTASGATRCKCAEEEEKDAASKYNVKVKDGVEQYNQTIEIDPEKKTEKVHIPSTSSSPGEIDIVYDFEKNLAMHRLADQKACFLSNSTDNLPKPKDLAKLFDKESSQGPVKAKPSSFSEYVIVGTLDDRSILSDEMADLCSKLPIYRVMKKSVVVDAEKQRAKRQTVCYRVRCWYVYYCCYVWGRAAWCRSTVCLWRCY